MNFGCCSFVSNLFIYNASLVSRGATFCASMNEKTIGVCVFFLAEAQNVAPLLINCILFTHI